MLHIITSTIFMYFLLFCYYTVITSLLLIIPYSLLPIIQHPYHIIITSLLYHYYIIITSLLPIAKAGDNEIIMYYAWSMFSFIYCYYLLLPIITH